MGPASRAELPSSEPRSDGNGDNDGHRHPPVAPAEARAALTEAKRRSAEGPVLREALERLSMGWSHADAEAFRATLKRDNAVFKTPVAKLGIKG